MFKEHETKWWEQIGKQNEDGFPGYNTYKYKSAVQCRACMCDLLFTWSKGTWLYFSGLLEAQLSARTYMNLSADRFGKTSPKANGGWVLDVVILGFTQEIVKLEENVSQDENVVQHT